MRDDTPYLLSMNLSYFVRSKCILQRSHYGLHMHVMHFTIYQHVNRRGFFIKFDYNSFDENDIVDAGN